jgi:ATP-dependent Clp protease ATP-binding subunit ClpC
MSKKSFRVHVIVHEDGRRTAKVLRVWDALFDRPAPSAYGATMDDVLAELEAKLAAVEVEGNDAIGRYLWDEEFRTDTIRVVIHPLSSIKKRPVIGKKEVPLVLTYASCPLKGGGYRVMLPRFGGWFIVEDLSLAAEVLRHAVSTLLVGENPRWVYDFRQVGDEYITEWTPPFLARAGSRARADGEPADGHTELVRVSDELVSRAARGKLPLVVGESDAFEQLKPLIAGPKPPSLLLVGPPGVGKTSLVRRLARHFASIRRDDGPFVPRIYSTSKDRIVAGMVYLGMWQERCMTLVRELADGDYLHLATFGGLLEPQPDGASIADFFEPAMDGGEVRLIVESTREELERARRARPSLVQRFHVVRVDEPTPVETTAIAIAYARRKAGLGIHPSAMKRLLRHLTALERGVAFPGKALRFIDWLAASRAPKETAGDAPPAATGDEATATPTGEEPTASRVLYPRDASEAYARYSGIPLTLLSDDVAASAEDLARLLKARVIGQDAACDACGRVLARFKANLVDPERPAATLLFVGPTGVGKTELAKQLARTTFGGEDRMIRLDMSEYMLAGAVSRLTSARAGTRSLASQVRQQPLSLVLLDEIEKAHPEVFDLLLGILGEGRMTDDNGRFVDFRTTLIVMTSNLGVESTRPAGFGDAPPAPEGFVRKVRAHFRPELYNRIDHVLAFRALAPVDVERIVDLELAALATRTGLVRRQLALRATPEARRRLAELGYDPTRGARPLRRLLEERVMTPVAARIAADPTFRNAAIPLVVRTEPPHAETGESDPDGWTTSSPRERSFVVAI